MRISNKDLNEILGGTTITGSIITAFTNIIKVLIEAGEKVGSSIRRVTSNNICPLE